MVILGGQPADKRLFFKPVEEPPAHYYAQFGMNESLHYGITVFRCSTTHSAWPYFTLYLFMGCVTICVNFCRKIFLYKIYFIGGDLNEYEKHFGAVFYCEYGYLEAHFGVLPLGHYCLARADVSHLGVSAAK